MQEIIEHVEGNPEIVAKLSMLADDLDEAERRLGTSQVGEGAEEYDIGGDESADEDGGKGKPRNPGGRNVQRQGGGASEGRGAGKATEWKPEGAGRWTRRTVGEEAQPQGKGVQAQNGGLPTLGEAGATTTPVLSEPLARTGVALPKGKGTSTATAGPAATGATAAGPSGGASGSAGSGGDQGHPRAPAGDDDDEPECREQEAKHRRRRTAEEARKEMDARKAMDLLQEQQAAMAAQVQSHQAGAGGFGSEAALSMAAQRFVHEVRQAEARAAKKGIDPRHEGKALLEVSPMELQRWIQANLGEDSGSEYSAGATRCDQQ